MIIVHSYKVPFFWTVETGPYLIDDNGRRDLPSGTTRKDILWFRRPYPGGKNEAFKIQLDWEVSGSGRRKYKVELYGDNWSCNCPSFKFSGNKRSCKHVDEIRSSYLS